MKKSIVLLVLFVSAMLFSAQTASAAGPCSNATLLGTYTVQGVGIIYQEVLRGSRRMTEGGSGFATEGVTPKGNIFGSTAAPLPFYATGVVTANGTGKLTFVLTTSIGGTIVRLYTFPGTYSVNADCTGTLTMMSGYLGIVVDFDTVFARNNTEFHGVSSGEGVGINIVLTQQ